MHPNAGRLFLVSCLALITSAFSFQMRQDTADAVGETFVLTKGLLGAVGGGQFLGMALAMLVFAALCDALGMGKVLFLAWIAHAVGIGGTIFAKELGTQGFAQAIADNLSGFSAWMTNTLSFSLLPDAGADKVSFWILWLSAFLIGSANGLVEIAINPLAATLYPDEKTHKLNVLHAWWPGGLILAGLIALGINQFLAKNAQVFGQFAIWQVKFGCLIVPWLLYGFLALGQRFPETERVQANVSFGEMLLQIIRPLFIVWCFCMLLTASTELGTNAWMNSVLTRTMGGGTGSGTAVFIFITAIMFVMRFFAGPITQKISPIGLLFFCSFLTAGGLYWLSFADTAVMAFAAAAVFAIGITFYWPTMLGVVAERFPKGGAFLLGLVGCVGNIAISQAIPAMGSVYDSNTEHYLEAKYKSEKISTKGAKEPVLDADKKPVDEVALIKSDKMPTYVPASITDKIFPSGGVTVVDDKTKKEVPGYRVIDPTARGLIPEPKKDEAGKRIEEPSDLLKAVEKAEIEGARWSFRWTVALPIVLILVFGLIVLFDLMRGGYRAERI